MLLVVLNLDLTTLPELSTERTYRIHIHTQERDPKDTWIAAEQDMLAQRADLSLFVHKRCNVSLTSGERIEVTLGIEIGSVGQQDTKTILAGVHVQTQASDQIEQEFEESENEGE
eukprot:c7508_g1_i3.p1 GENE.c7508_g1_i3~~c7508_g1_i3.p1  ORF type:complete len:115 (+),score=26.77 c7508_g1_i3:237-581(+)